MIVYRIGWRITIHVSRHWGITLHRDYLRPSSESWPGYSYWQLAGICIWHDTTKPLTVGERGVW